MPDDAHPVGSADEEEDEGNEERDSNDEGDVQVAQHEQFDILIAR